MIMISDIDNDVRESIFRCFTGDTRISEIAETAEDEENMQKDVDLIY